MTPGSIEWRVRIGRDLRARRIDETQARRRLAGCIGLGSDDLALLTVMELEARVQAERLRGDAGQAFSEVGQPLEDAMAALGMALAAETAQQVEAA